MTSAEAVATLATHRCRHDPSLKIRPQHCRARKQHNKRISNPYMLASWQIHEECIDCPGAVLPGESVPPQPKAEPKPEETPSVIDQPWEPYQPKPHLCLTCGETDPKKFYGRHKSSCKACDIKKGAERQKAAGGYGRKVCTVCGRTNVYRRKRPNDPMRLEHVCAWCRVKDALKR